MIDEHLPPPRVPREGRRLAQGYVPAGDKDEVNRIRKVVGHSWDEIVTAACREYIKRFEGVANGQTVHGHREIPESLVS